MAQPTAFSRVMPTEEVNWGIWITSITQDTQGYLWFTTHEGLFRYDGYQVTAFLHDPTGANSVSAGNLEVVYADSKGYIWVGSWLGVLNRFDPATSQFTHYNPNVEHYTDNVSGRVTSILEDRKGFIWVGTHAGLHRLDPANGQFAHFLHNPKDDSSLSNNQVRAIYEDRQGTLWIGTGSPWPNESPAGAGGLNRFDSQRGKFTRYMHHAQDSSTLIDNHVRAIFEDSRGNFWVGTYGDGLHLMDRKKGTFQRLQYDPKQPNKLSRPYPKKNMSGPGSYGPGGDGVSFIQEDGLGNLWVGSLYRGVNRYNPSTHQVTHFERDSITVDGLKDDFLWTAYRTREGVLFMGSAEGNLYRINPYYTQLSFHPTTNPVFAFHQWDSGELWVGTDKGIIVVDHKIGKQKRLLHQPTDSNSLGFDDLNVFYEDRRGNLWIGTYGGGLDQYDPNKKHFMHYRHQTGNAKSLINDTVTAIYEDKKENLWIGTLNGLSRLNRQRGSFTSYTHNSSDSTSLSNNRVHSFAEDGDGNLWMATNGEAGLHKYNPQTNSFQRYTSLNYVGLIQKGRTGGLLMRSSRFGLIEMNPRTGSVIPITNPNTGKRILNVNDVVVDKNGSLWISTSAGLIYLNDKEQISKIYHIPNSTARPYIGPAGELFLGGVSGYYSFSTNQLPRNLVAPQIVLNAFELEERSIQPGDSLPPLLPDTKKIFLKHYQNAFFIDFAGIHFGEPERNRHQYWLENYEPTWRKAGVEKKVTYYNIPPGEYIFHAKAASSDGVWAERRITIVISPPWWRTTWAYLLYGVLFTGSIWAFIQFRSRRLIKEKKILEHKVTIRTHELKEANEELNQQKEEIAAQRDQVAQTLTELQATQAQLVQREKMASLGELTAGIAHEIQNPLNFVNNFSEVSEELCNELEEEAKAGNTEEVLSLTADLKQNLEKIHHHGKRADSIVKGMLQHSRISSGEKQPTDINALVDEYLRLAYHGLRAKEKDFNAQFELQTDSTIGKIEIVPQEIGRVLLNLFNNAFYATAQMKSQLNGQYQPQVTVTTKAVGNKVEIRIKDNGTGIPAAVQQKIFQPFFTTKPTGEGTGLGLSLSYDIITKGHGGDLKVESKEGEYSEFIIGLPIHLNGIHREGI
jgi:signal transduction histidine kinase/ligand-binding sensor domain-containing protein